MDASRDLSSVATNGEDPGVGFATGGPYRFIQLLGEGGMGEVWLAEQTRPVKRLERTG